LRPPSGFHSVHVAALNNLGQVVGGVDSTNRQTHAFLWENGVTTDLGTFGAAKSLASGINDSGDIVGAFLTNGQRHAFLRHNGHVQDLGVIDTWAKLGDEGEKYQGGPWGIYWTTPVAINASGQVTGHLVIGNNDDHRSFVVSAGAPAFFGLISNVSIFYAEAINNRGHILGRATPPPGDTRMRSMLWKDGAFVDISSLDGTECTAHDFNDRGAVVGVAKASAKSPQRAFVWEAGKVRWLTGTNIESCAYAANNHGVVVGYAHSRAKGYFACLWQDGEMRDLNRLVTLEPGWQLIHAQAVNDRGQILTRAVNGNRERYFLLSPSDMAAPAPSQTILAEANAPALTPFNLTSLQALPNGQIRLAFSGSAAAKYVVEASTNLVDWLSLGPATNTDGRVEFTDAEATKFPMRFYRIFAMPPQPSSR
jgi:probable HAF family extracellular repeat protein